MHVIIIGSGLAGYIAAKEIRDNHPDLSLQLICQDKGDFYSKPLLSTSIYQNKQPSDLITHTAKEMEKRYRMTMTTETKVEAIDPLSKTIQTQDKTYQYDKLVIATGALPRKLNQHWETLDGVQHINHLDDYQSFRERLQPRQSVAIVGSGLVGIEYANDLLLTDHSVEMFSLLPYPLYGLVPEAIGNALLDILKQQSMKWIQTDGIKTVAKSDNISISTEESITTKHDQVLLAVGFSPNITLAKTAQLTCDQGIVTNKFAQTSNEHIFALGDCAQSPKGVEFYISAIRKAAYAIARNLTEVATPIQSKLTPIVIKSPLYPIVVCFKDNQRVGQWHIEGEDNNLISKLIDQSGKKIGFALSGESTKHKQDLLQWLDSE